LNSLPFIRLSELAGMVYRVIDDAFSELTFWVVADVANHSYRAYNNHHYFDLVEKDKQSSAIISKIPTRAWSEGGVSISAFEAATGQRFTNDLHLLVQVSVFYHPVYGLQLTLINIDNNYTLGALEQQKQATLLRLVNENARHIRLSPDGYITFNQELPLPLVIQDIAVISSSTSAGMEDFLHTLQTNTHHFQFRIDPYYSIVQGELNARYVVDQFIAIYNSGKKYDAIILIRGGGSQTDLLLFEQYAIGRAIARFPVPVITGIGHQKNETIADLMAHTAVKTPTKAAEFIVAHNKAFADSLLSLEKNMIIRAQQILSAQNKALSQVSQRMGIAGYYLNQKKHDLQSLSAALTRRSGLVLYQKQKNLESKAAQMKLASGYYLKSRHIKLDKYVSLIRLISPGNVLKKGFAIVKQNGKMISNAAAISPGNEIAVILAGQELNATVTQKTDYDGRDFNL